MTESVDVGPRWSSGRCAFVGAMHVGAICALVCWDWTLFWVSIFLMVVTGPLGLGVGYHRGITHKSFSTSSWFRWVLCFLGTLGLQGGVIRWVATHRLHHSRSDRTGDPHSPRDGMIWSHVLWALERPDDDIDKLEEKYAQDVLEQPGLRWLDTNFFAINAAFVGVLAVIAGYVTNIAYVPVTLLWLLCFRVVYIWHITWFINSAAHRWGRIRYATADSSRNNWWVAVIAFGEGWHNNHHAFPNRARHGHAWFELDANFAMIRALEVCGLVWDVNRAPAGPAGAGLDSSNSVCSGRDSGMRNPG